MTLLLALIFLMCLWRIKFAKPVLTGLNENYLAMDRTNSIKGIFILLVFLSHARNYVSMLPSYSDDTLNNIYNIFQNHLGQGVVVMFLFYSGYGVMESIKKKGTEYIRSFPKNRIAKTLFNFDIAVILFIILDLCLGTLKNYSVPQVILSFIGWKSVGNSNWYIFAVLIMYLVTYVAFTIFKNKAYYAATLVTVLTVAYVGVLVPFKESWWFDTVILYPLGIWYSLCKDKIEFFVKKKPVNYYLLFILCAFVFAVSHLLRSNIICYEISLIAFCAVVVAVTMKVDINNKILSFFGRHLFEIYILMRIPMIALLHFNITNTYLFVLISFAVTVPFALLFKKILGFLDGKLFSDQKAKSKEFDIQKV